MNKLLTVAAASYAGLGVVALVDPERIPSAFGGSATTPAARTEIRAVYGGMPLALAASVLLKPSTALFLGGRRSC